MSETDPIDLVHCTTVQTAMEAEVARIALEAEGIACDIQGESQAGLTGVLPIKIYVRSEDLERALEVVEPAGKGGDDADDDSEA
ncbi:MAG TPA: DUF2007 domain-containing protein [Pirellulales bacterium]|nr:DUF2007 domain-containing protein [Pirellulales bacterium]